MSRKYMTVHECAITFHELLLLGNNEQYYFSLINETIFVHLYTGVTSASPMSQIIA